MSELPNENPNKRPMEIGYVPRYKPRKVSAVRDFPPGCGPNAVPVDLKLEENGYVAAQDVEAKSVKTSIVANGVQDSEMADVMEANGVGNSEIANNVEANGVSTAEISEFMRPESVKSSEIGNVVRTGDVKSPMVETESQPHEFVNNPIEIEMTESSDMMVGEVMTTTMDGLSNCVADTRKVGDELQNASRNSSVREVNEEGQTILEGINRVKGLDLVKNMGSEKAKPALEIGTSIDRMVCQGGSQLTSLPNGSIANGIVNMGTSSRPKDKYSRRRVSAIRDFPPFCGTNAPPPNQQEQQMMTTGKGNLDVIEKCELETDTTQTLRKNLEREASSEMRTSQTKCLNDVETVDIKTEANETRSDATERGPFREKLTGVTQTEAIHDMADSSDENTGGPVGRDISVYSTDRSGKERTSESSSNALPEVVHALMAAPNFPWKNEKEALNKSDEGTSARKVRKLELSRQKKFKAVAKKSSGVEAGSSTKKRAVPISNDGNPGALFLRDETNYDADGDDLPANSPPSHKPCDFDVSLPPFGPKTSTHSDARNRVRETLRLFHAICRKILQGEEAKSVPEVEGQSGNSRKRIDLIAAKMIKEKKKEVNTGKQILGAVPGVEVGDEFQYRVELAIVGVHRLYQAGIDSMKHTGILVATSIVSSGGYDDDVENADVLTYSGQGGNAVGKNKQPEDQKLERGNLALYNSISAETPVRVIRGWKEKRASDSLDSRAKLVTNYVYDGLYTVTKYWTETGKNGKLVFMFELRRNPGQPELAWKELSKSNKAATRRGVCVSDISEGKEPSPICAFNILDGEKPPPFNYITKMLYPDWYRPVAPEGCECLGKCSDSRKCQCAVRNGGEIPYNRNGAIVEAKPLVYECGPFCKCPPSCYNRVSQHGIKFRLEIFKTKSRGWGVRSVNSIPSGSFICEYAGELLEDREAEQRIGNDEYLFDIGHNYSDPSLKQEERGKSVELVQEGGYTIDAAQYGNIGRFINHSCSPNLYAQNVIYDHDDRKIPHVMFFAAENIPPLQELTYHYNYSVDQVRDSNGNIKMKRCYCGASECTGRMY